jgi:arylsulfatase A-like enzyme
MSLRVFVKSLWIILLLAIIVVAVIVIHSGQSNRTWQEEIENIVLISIDTCRADYLSCYGYERKTTPNIDSVAEGSILFENVITPIPQTLPAHCSMLTGTTPLYHGIHDNLGYQLGPSNITLAEILSENGYKTGAVIGSFVLDSQFGLKQGFDSYSDHFEDEVTTGRFIERKAEEVSRFGIEWLQKNYNENFFLFLHYYDPHFRYEPPEPFASSFEDNLYAGEVAYTDHCIGQVIQKLKKLGVYDSTLLIITSDHGEMLGEHGEIEHGYFIYQSAIKVPLIIKLAGQNKPQKISHLASLNDIVPTICGLLGIQPPSCIQGKDLSVNFTEKTTTKKKISILREFHAH